MTGSAGRILSGSIQWVSTKDADSIHSREQYLPVLEDIKSLTPNHIPSAENALDTLTQVIFLDQMPRNCFRGLEAKTVFTVFDRLALDLSLRSLFPKTFEAGFPNESASAQTGTPWYDSDATVLNQEDMAAGLDHAPEIRHRFFYRMWFLLPLTHSESLKVHDWADTKNKAMLEDLQRMEFPTPEDKEKALGFNAKLTDAEHQHRVILERFGRYPHRNKPLGRESTPEEIHYLENGGQTFGS